MLNVVLLMAGAGSRFKEAGYKDPKPLIKIKNTPMFIKVLENLNLTKEVNYIILCQLNIKDKVKEYLLKYRFENHIIITVDKVTEGACCTALLAKEHINKKDELIIVNCDQLVLDRLFLRDALNYFRLHNADGGIICFLSDENKYSYVRLNGGKISEVAEKQVISNLGTIGIYQFAKGSDFIEAAERMISKNIRCRNEFYLSPVYNELIVDGKKILPFMVNQFYGIGTPKDLEEFLKIY